MYLISPIKCYVIGGAVVIYSAVSYSKKKKRLNSWVHTTGSVQNVRRRSDGETTLSVKFTDEAGQLRTASMKVADGDTVGLGSEIEISYNPKKPEEAFVSNAKDMTLSLYIPLVAGFIIIALGIGSEIMLSRAGY